MRYRVFIARKPALTVCLLLCTLWAPGSSARRTAGDSADSSVRLNSQDLSILPTDGVAVPFLQPKPKASNRLDSPSLMALARKVKAGNRAALKLFWEEVQGKTPLVEPVPGDDQLRRVTFLWRGGAEGSEVRLESQILPDSQGEPLLRLPNTDVWFLTDRLPAAARFTYNFARPGKRQIFDPLNPRKFRSSSYAELPAAPPQPWIVMQPDVPKGTLSHEKLRSENLKEERSVSIY